jgi:hypothetical protein
MADNYYNKHIRYKSASLVVQHRDEGMISVLRTDTKPCSWSALDGAVALLDSLFR